METRLVTMHGVIGLIDVAEDQEQEIFCFRFIRHKTAILVQATVLARISSILNSETSKNEPEEKNQILGK
jgi:hypothetical protein